MSACTLTFSTCASNLVSACTHIRAIHPDAVDTFTMFPSVCVHLRGITFLAKIHFRAHQILSLSLISVGLSKFYRRTAYIEKIYVVDIYIYIYIISWVARATCAMENFPKAFYNIHSVVSRNELSTPLRDPVSKHDTFAQLTSPFRWSVENILLTFNSRDARLLFSRLRESLPALSHKFLVETLTRLSALSASALFSSVNGKEPVLMFADVVSRARARSRKFSGWSSN